MRHSAKRRIYCLIQVYTSGEKTVNEQRYTSISDTVSHMKGLQYALNNKVNF